MSNAWITREPLWLLAISGTLPFAASKMASTSRAAIRLGDLLHPQTLPKTDDRLHELEVGLLKRLLLIRPLLLLLARGGASSSESRRRDRRRPGGASASWSHERRRPPRRPSRDPPPPPPSSALRFFPSLPGACAWARAWGGEGVPAADGLDAVGPTPGLELGLAAILALLRAAAARGFLRARHRARRAGGGVRTPRRGTRPEPSATG